MILDFERDTAGRKSAEFWRWLQTHQREYFVNVTSPRAGRIHRADCPHMKFPEPHHVNFVARRKVCSPDRGELERWASRERVQITTCPDCDRIDVRSAP